MQTISLLSVSVADKARLFDPAVWALNSFFIFLAKTRVVYQLEHFSFHVHPPVSLFSGAYLKVAIELVVFYDFLHCFDKVFCLPFVLVVFLAGDFLYLSVRYLLL